MKMPSYAAVLALVLGAVVTAAPPSSGAVARDAVSVADRVGDVRIVRKATGLPRAQRTSIDLRRVDVEPRADAVRFTVRLRTVLRTRAFDQMVFLRLAPPSGSSETWSGDIGMSAQRRGSVVRQLLHRRHRDELRDLRPVAGAGPPPHRRGRARRPAPVPPGGRGGRQGPQPHGLLPLRRGPSVVPGPAPVPVPDRAPLRRSS